MMIRPTRTDAASPKDEPDRDRAGKAQGVLNLENINLRHDGDGHRSLHRRTGATGYLRKTAEQQKRTHDWYDDLL